MKNNYFCENLRFLRTSLNISQKEIANYLNLNPSSYSNYENGRREPNLNALINICSFLNITIDKLLTENLSNDINFLKNIQNKVLNDFDIKNKIENINQEQHLELLNILKEKKIFYSNLISKDIPKKISEIDKLIEYLEVYNQNFKNELANEISAEVIDLEEYKKNKKNVKCRMVPISGNVSAGDPCYAEEDLIDIIPIPENLLCSSKEYYILYIKGDSMNKLFKPKELILVEHTHCVSTNDIAIVLVGTDEATVKKVEIYEDYINLVPMSNNPIHKTKTINIRDVCIQGKVIGKLFDIIRPSL